MIRQGILQAISQGDPVAADELLPLVYHELRNLAAQKMAKQKPGHTLQPTALVHDAWVRLTGGREGAQFANRAHFFAAAAESMRRILIDSARRKLAARHGGGQEKLDIHEIEIAAASAGDELLAVNEALDKFASHDKVKAELVKLRYFVGMNFEEAAEALEFQCRQRSATGPTHEPGSIMKSTRTRYEIRSSAHLSTDVSQKLGYRETPAAQTFGPI